MYYKSTAKPLILFAILIESRGGFSIHFFFVALAFLLTRLVNIHIRLLRTNKYSTGGLL